MTTSSSNSPPSDLCVWGFRSFPFSPHSIGILWHLLTLGACQLSYLASHSSPFFDFILAFYQVWFLDFIVALFEWHHLKTCFVNLCWSHQPQRIEIIPCLYISFHHLHHRQAFFLISSSPFLHLFSFYLTSFDSFDLIDHRSSSLYLLISQLQPWTVSCSPFIGQSIRLCKWYWYWLWQGLQKYYNCIANAGRPLS